MPHPLSNIAEKKIVTGKIFTSNLNLNNFDDLGNPELSSIPVTLTLLVKEKNNPEFKASYGLDISQVLLECHILKSPNNFDFKLLDNVLTTEEGKTLTIVNRAGYFLKPLRKVFGTKFLAILSD